MKVYFVRHGESVLNRENRHQLPDTPLSKRGHKQAVAIARRFTHIPVDIILTSSYTRALQTAQAIEKVKSAPLIQSELLIERRMPSLFHGKSVDDPEIVLIHQNIRDHFEEPQWHYADEENFMDLLSRVKSVLESILSQQKESVVVVTHGYLLTLIINHILFGDQVTYPFYKSFMTHAALSNTGLTMCEYTDKKWTLLTWNDYAHLGE